MRLNLAAAIYGTLTAGSVLAIESAQRETYAETVVATVLALLLYWLAHSYAEYTSERLEQAEAVKLERLASTMASEVTILLGAGVPLAAVAVAWVAAAPLSTAVNAGIWTAVGTLLGLEGIVAWRAQLTGRRLAAQILFGAVLGVGTLGLKLILH